MEPGLGQDNYYTLIFSNVRLLKAMLFSISLFLYFFFFFFVYFKSISWFWVGRSVGRFDEKQTNLLKNPLQKKRKKEKKKPQKVWE